MSVTQILERIAREHLNIPTLYARNSDSLDFHVVAVWSIRKALMPPIWQAFAPASLRQSHDTALPCAPVIVCACHFFPSARFPRTLPQL